MLTEKEVRATILQRLLVADGSCNSAHLFAVEGQIRALVSVLNDGEPPPVFNGDPAAVCKAAGIPFDYSDDRTTIGWPEEWLKEHGFIINGDDIHHPKLGLSW